MITKKTKILIVDNFFDPVIGNLQNIFDLIYPENLENNLKDIQGIITNPWFKIDEQLIGSLPQLKIISCFGTGIDSVDKIAATKRGIIITNTPDIVTEDTADIAMTLLLCLSRNIIFNDQYVKTGNWAKSTPPLGMSISGKTVGIIGLGKIGQRIADRAICFGLNVIYYNKTKKESSLQYYENLEEMAKKSHFLIVCCTANNDTKNMINLKILKALGNKGFLINISRGSTVNENDLIFSLENKIIRGAGLDVFQNEPNINEKFFTLENIILLPHIGTATAETRIKMLNLTLDNIKSYFQTGKALNIVE
jgi:lactate dehydrogenase-like 2-hydroxyacid dehydrogenase